MEGRRAEDHDLVESALRGNHEAFAMLVRQYQNLVASVAWRYGVRRDDIEDAVSEVFVKVYQGLHRYRPEHPFSTWLYRLAANHVLDRARRAHREKDRGEMPEQLPDRAPGAVEGLETQERASVVRAALEGLDPRYREALFLVYVEGLRVDEAARVLGVPEGTVKTRLMRGRQALKRLLERRHPEHFGG
jgi:RNA polymerase sigma-70 factor (ECF subfamily)